MPTAMEIYKLLPKTNCGDCHVPTCLAFAMQLANRKVSLSECPHVGAEAKQALEESAAPPIALVKFGGADRALSIGDETQLFRHEKTFYHPTVIGAVLDDTLPEAQLKAEIEKAVQASFVRVGQTLRLDALAIRNASGEEAPFLAAVRAASEAGNLPLILMTTTTSTMERATALAAASRPLLCGATAENLPGMAKLAKETGLPLVLRGARSLSELAELAGSARSQGLKELVLELPAKSLGQMLRDLTAVRRAAVKTQFRPFGYPTLLALDGSSLGEVSAALAVFKYGSVVLLERYTRELLYALLTLRQNIFTDPQVPIQVKPGLYSIGDPGPNSPLLFTCNFSLTYFTVSADIEKAKVPTWLLVVDTEGLSVMTAFAANKLTVESVVKALETYKVREVSHRGELVIPGIVSRMSGKLGEAAELSIVVGPRESSGLPKFLREFAARPSTS